MNKGLHGVCLSAILTGSFAWCAAASVEKTMSVARCQAVLENGKQCTAQASEGKQFCWRHHGAAKAVGDGCTAVGDGAKSAWQATKTWSTNAFEKTCRGTEKAMNSTREAFKEAGDEFSKMMRETFKKDTQKGMDGK